MGARLLLLAGVAAILAGCNQRDSSAASNETANAVASAPKHPTYCFFKDADTKGWNASRDASGNVTVKGKAHLEDSRYAAQLGQLEVSGPSASLWLTMGPNTAATGAPDNWWDVTAAIPSGASLDTVSVMCGKKTVAQLKVPAAS